MNSPSVSMRSTKKILLSVSLMLILNAVIGIQAQHIENANLYPYNPPLEDNGANPAESGTIDADELFVFIPPDSSNGDNPNQSAASVSGTKDELYPYIPPETSSTKSPSTGLDSVVGDFSSFTLHSANSGVWRSQCQGIILSLIVGAIFI